MRQYIGQQLFWFILPRAASNDPWLGRAAYWFLERVFHGYSFYAFKPEEILQAISSEVKPLFPE